MEGTIHEGGVNPASITNPRLDREKEERSQGDISKLIKSISNSEISEKEFDETAEQILSMLEYDKVEIFAQELWKLQGEEKNNAKAVLEKIFPEKHIPAFEDLDLEMKKELNEKFGLKLSEN